MISPRKTGAGNRPSDSTGPRSASRKTRSRTNALKSGIDSKSGTIPGEDPAQLAALLVEYSQRYGPTLPEQRDQVDILVRSTWTLRRLAAAETQIWIYQMDRTLDLSGPLDLGAPLGHAFHNCDHTLTRLHRMVDSTQRNYRDALRELERLQALGPPVQLSPPPQTATQSVETKPVSRCLQFVSRTPTRFPAEIRKDAPKAPQEPLPFHQPGSNCRFDPIDREKYTRCPFCFPADDPCDKQA